MPPAALSSLAMHHLCMYNAVRRHAYREYLRGVVVLPRALGLLLFGVLLGGRVRLVHLLPYPSLVHLLGDVDGGQGNFHDVAVR